MWRHRKTARRPFETSWTAPCNTIAVATGKSSVYTPISRIPPAIPNTPDSTAVPNATKAKSKLTIVASSASILARIHGFQKRIGGNYPSRNWNMLDKLEALQALAATGTMGRAAASLRHTQSAASKRIGALGTEHTLQLN